MAIYTFLQVLRFRYNSIKPIEKMSRQHFKNSFEVLGKTVEDNVIYLYIQGYPQRMRLQRRLYGIFLVRFLSFRVPIVGQNCLFCALSFSEPSKYSIAKTKNQTLNRRIFIISFVQRRK